MTEQDWLSSNDPAAMLELLRTPGKGGIGRLIVSDRKLRLFACACCRRVGMTGVGNNAVGVAEQVADGWDDRGLMWDAYNRTGCPAALDMARAAAYQAVAVLNLTPAESVALLRDIVGNPFRPVKARRIREVAFGPVAVECEHGYDVCPQCDSEPAPWLTPTVLALAQAAYDERSSRECPVCKGIGRMVGGVFDPANCSRCGRTGRIPTGTLDADRLAVLADALEDAGCTEAVILEHLRGPGPHVRGCWALDLITGRE